MPPFRHLKKRAKVLADVRHCKKTREPDALREDYF